ncbi:hypothetical protein M407DRAFT_26739 [Tulasnella calospora MUT 4182]|uniref:Uncharacterized protein n=1 Tax=Tulasnella calospora MUT 4182 TaxID=1051891 RepID=A0A0C3QDR9_9AGAM|nr:hypothetical protein M407DRAFT_26739 [Tulasnella calospora MUT 4182]
MKSIVNIAASRIALAAGAATFLVDDDDLLGLRGSGSRGEGSEGEISPPHSSSQLFHNSIYSSQPPIHTSPMDYYYTLSSTVSSAAASTRPQEVVIDIVDYEGGSTGGQGYCTIA